MGSARITDWIDYEGFTINPSTGLQNTVFGALSWFGRMPLRESLRDRLERFPDRREGYNKTLAVVLFYLAAAFFTFGVITFVYAPPLYVFYIYVVVFLLPALIYIGWYRKYIR